MDVSAELRALRAANETAGLDAARASARAETLETELRASANELAETRTGLDAERANCARLARDMEELKRRSDSEAAEASTALESEKAARAVLEVQVWSMEQALSPDCCCRMLTVVDAVDWPSGSKVDISWNIC